MAIGIIEILASLGLLICILYYRLTTQFSFWKKLQVKGPKPDPIFGNSKDSIFGRKNMNLIFKKFYDDYKTEKFFGIYDRSSPMLVIRDLDLIKDVLIKDFIHFPDRGVIDPNSQDPFEENLVNLKYEQWRPLKSYLTPAFTSGKLKDMFYLNVECAQKFESCVAEIAEKGDSVGISELTTKYTIDTIGVCIFGLNLNATGDDNGGFYKFVNQLLDKNFANAARVVSRELFPRFYAFIRPLVYNRAEDFFINSMKETMDYRRKSGFKRNDFVDILMDLKGHPNEKHEHMEITDKLLTAQAFVFFLAGFHTSATTMSHLLYELAFHPLCQDKVREEIREVLLNHRNFTYENINDLKYLDKVIKEAMRMYPSVPLLRRLSATSYTFTGTKLTIPKNTQIAIPVWAIHRDPNIWPDPDTFNPERFNDEHEKLRHSMAYLPFGSGPRNCIGLRFANYQIKIGMATLINKFKVVVCDKTTFPYRLHPRGFVPKPIGEIYLKFIKL